MSVENTINEQLTTFKNALLNIPSSDILVHCDLTIKKLKTISSENIEEPFEIDSTWKTILKQNEIIAASNASSTLSLASGIFKSEKDTPIFITPLEFKWIQKNQRFQLTPIWENTFVNPWLLKSISEYIQEIHFDNELSVLENIENVSANDFFKSQGIEIQSNHFVGNFHHHRFLILREIETLINQPKSQLIQHLFGENTQAISSLTFKEGHLSAQDSDQKTAIDAFQKQNLVVEGPPGTGKSTLITNLIGKSIVSNYNVLLFSEKKSALDIIYQKAKQHHFEHLCYFNPENKTEIFIRALEHSWKKSENYLSSEFKNLQLSKQYRNQLQNLLDKLNSPTLIENTSFKSIQEWFEFTPPTKAIFELKNITIEDWNKYENTIEKIYEGEHKLAPFFGYKNSSLISKNEFQNLNEKCSLFLNYYEKFELKNKKLLNSFKRKISFLQIINNEKNKSYFLIYLNKNKKDKFIKLIQRFEIQKRIYSQHEYSYNSWKSIPTLTQLEEWKQILLTGSFFQKWKVKSTLKNFIKDTASSPLKLIDELISSEKEKQKLTDHFISLQKLGINHPESEISQIQLTLSLINNYQDILEEINPEDLNQLLDEKFACLELINWLENKINFPEGADLKIFIQDLQSDLHFNAKNCQFINNITPEILKFIQQNKNISNCKQTISNHYYYLLKQYFPQLIEFNNDKIISLVNQIVEQEKIEQDLFEKDIIRTQYNKLQEYQQLILQSDSKLSNEQKEFKKQLKNGKRILVKAFCKSRHRQSIRDYLETDAIHWVKILLPIWLVTPSQLASLFPMEENLFDICISDEASQIPLMNGLGALQRSRRAIVLGDSKQMSPTYYFNGLGQTEDLLHHCSYYFEKKMLKHHYRSKHSSLIEFSNKNFYNNELHPFPSSNAEIPLHLHFIENGRFENRTNTLEAEKINILITKEIHSTKKIGIVAFSNEQKELILKSMPTETRLLLEEKISYNNAFIKSLEQVQGDECDVLFISLGYAKNSNNHFQLQMGPLNRKNGYRRLNVLFTRAKSSIHFVTSVKSCDFPWTDNENIQLLKNYIFQLENNKHQGKLTFPFGLTPLIDDTKLQIPNLHTKITNQSEMVTCIDTLQKRGWQIR
jgi:superfamily I DNA and/or RNA helicase